MGLMATRMPFNGKINGLLTAISGELLPDNVVMVLYVAVNGAFVS